MRSNIKRYDQLRLHPEDHAIFVEFFLLKIRELEMTMIGMDTDARRG